MELGYDNWLNLAATAGLSLYFFSHWVRVRGKCRPRSFWNWLGRTLGLSLILLPLFLQWYLSSPLLVLAAVALVAASGWQIYRARSQR